MLRGRTLAFVGAILGGVAVLVGAFGAHALKDSLTPERMATYQTAVSYLQWHSVALILSGTGFYVFKNQAFQRAGHLFLMGIVLFCGSLFVLVLADMPIFGAVAPFGGLSFAAGWFLFAFGCKGAMKADASIG